MFADYAVLCEYFRAMGAAVFVVDAMFVCVLFELEDLGETFFAHGTFEDFSAYQVAFAVAGERGGIEEALRALVALIWFGFVGCVY